MQMVDSRNDQEWVTKASGLKHAYPLAFSRLNRTSAVTVVNDRLSAAPR